MLHSSAPQLAHALSTLQIVKETGSGLSHCICLMEIFPKPCTDSACPRIKALPMITSSHQGILSSAFKASSVLAHLPYMYVNQGNAPMDASDLYTCTSIEQPHKGDNGLPPPLFMSDLMKKL